ncbi:CDP-alcohol phosphatidyltransferase family protein [Spirilliplanes yamanashiensis]|uniref:Membrane protein n=1 Tax=Spirilliplanes yamanashiensis TaxID=42233 RepID=A0A8J3YB87_9ACTN|nr:CDP-alcohol phosphatidyltransferase family protein [Spirilliplanes yamanashiensis]MDP9819066.1 phosphatidylglycerophosphate synthase [Spirilliplanes yamanashiensis]GIJ05521.1 membrane protein [Spirilliplanes yamanashiensis]
MTTSTHPVATVTADAPAVGLVAQFALLATLGATVGLGPAGWVTGGVFGVGLWLLLLAGLRTSGLRAFGPANQVTLARATLVGGVAALIADSFTRGVPVAVLIVLASVALLLDGVDGKVARRTGTCSPFGARFDMEVDAFLILALSAYVAADFGAWVLAIGAMRYLFVAASWAWPWLDAALPPKFARKVVAAVQGVALVVAGSGLLPWAAGLLVVVAALGALCWSFGTDSAWLWRSAHRTPVPA